MIREIFQKIEQDYVEENEIDLIENLIKVNWFLLAFIFRIISARDCLSDHDL